MAVYVDDAHIPAKVGNLDRCWSHLMADTPEELHVFAAQLGLKRSWFQDHKPFWHYDVTDGMRQRALALGAKPITAREAVQLPHWQRQKAGPGSATADAQELTGRQQADAWARAAREHWEGGRLVQAAAYNDACWLVNPERAQLWRTRADRLLEAVGRGDLSTQTAVRLAVSGIAAHDEAVQQVRDWNRETAEREATS
jgi:hypothetical protein